MDLRLHQETAAAFVVCASAAVWAWSPPNALAAPLETVTVEASRDNTLFSTETTSNGAGDGIFSGRTGEGGGGTRLRALMKFDVAAALPAGSTVLSAALTLTLTTAPPGASDQVHSLHRVLGDWGEGLSAAFGGQGAPAQPGDATWLHAFFPDEFWTTEGGDFAAAASAATTVGAEPGAYSWNTTAAAVSDVQDWLDQPAANFGWLLRGNEDDLMTARKFASREHARADARPLLAITYLPPCPDDGQFCNGQEMIDSRLGCVSMGNPCEPGEFCNEQAMRCDGCAQDEDCDDGVPCTGDRCVGGHCTFEAVDANCPDDGLFCNGSPRCDLSAGCVGGVPPCPAAACDEDQDRCGCAASTDCDDGLFCNGAEVCELAQCVPGVAPCKRCDEQHGACLRCRSDGDCDDSFFCNGLETCNIADGTCQPGEDPCPMLRCNEASSDCTECLSDSDCDDGLFCNGLETCAAPSCLPGTAPCPGACLEDSDACGPPKKDRPRSPPELPADADEDGVADDADQCPQTPLEEDADEAGCAPSQLDQADGPAACGTGVLGAGSALCLLLCPARRLRRRTVSIGGGANQREMCVMRKSDAFGLRIVLLAAVTASAVGGCGGSSEPPAQREPVSFSADIQPILNARCVVCHSPGGEAVEEGIPQDLRAAAAYADLVNQPSVLRPDLVLVVPGDASASLLYLKVSSDTPPVGEPMPSGVQRLSAAQIDQIRQWIDEGALEN